MNKNRISQLRALEGRRVSVALADGSRIDDGELISAGRPGLRSVWVYANGADTFVPMADVVDVWEPGCHDLSQAA
jgi:hypothetical protein